MVNTFFEENLKWVANAAEVFAEEGFKSASKGFSEAYDVASYFGERAWKVFAIGVDGLTRCFRQVEGIRAISTGVLAGITALQAHNIPTQGLEKIAGVLRSVRDAITMRNPVLRLSEFLTGDAIWKYAVDGLPNLVRLASRISSFIYDSLLCLQLAEKWSLVAEGTGNLVTLSAFGQPIKEVCPIFGYIGASLELADGLSLIAKDGLNWDNGFMVGTSASKLISIQVGGSEDFIPVMLKAMSGIASTLLYAAKFIRTEYSL